MKIRALAPLRISFAGGGTDVPPYCDERGGAVLSATINRHAFVTLESAPQFEVTSLDYDATITYGIEDRFVYDGTLDLAKGVIDHFREHLGLRAGFKVLMHNDAPPGSGLGSSSAMTVALVAAISAYMMNPLDPYATASLAYEIERNEVGIVGGKQDQYASAFGGVNFIEFNRDSTLVTPLRIPRETLFELEYRLCFAYVGGDRVYSNIVKKQQENFSSGVGSAVQAMDKIKELAFEMKRALLVCDLDRFGELLDEGWENKKRMAEGITNASIDRIYTEAKGAGAIGGKIAGAGGGGFMFFICDPFRKHLVQEALRRCGCDVVNFSFFDYGAQAWRIGSQS